MCSTLTCFLWILQEKLSKTLTAKDNEIIIKRNTIDSCRTQIQVLIKDKKDLEAKLQQVVSKSIEQVVKQELKPV